MAIKVFFNNSCNVCRLEINHYKKIADSNLEWVDITNNDEALKLTSKSGRIIKKTSCNRGWKSNRWR